MTSLTNINTAAATEAVLEAGSTFEDIFNAVVEYRARKERRSNPFGEFDSAGRFFIGEGCSCCDDIARPTRSFPYGQMNHGRTLAHVAHKFNVEDYMAIVRKAKSVYEQNGAEACKTYLASGKVRDAVIAVDLGL